MNGPAHGSAIASDEVSCHGRKKLLRFWFQRQYEISHNCVYFLASRNTATQVNSFFSPIISDLGGYPPGLDRASLIFIVPLEANRRKWQRLEGINLWDGKIYRIRLRPVGSACIGNVDCLAGHQIPGGMHT